MKASFEFTAQEAQALDREDPLHPLRQEFYLPAPLYFAGHSLGPQPRKVQSFIQQELETWAQRGVSGHFAASRHCWLDYNSLILGPLARLVGARESEVVAMNALTTNLHLMLVSFYRPTSRRYKILIENNTFPSDKYAVDSQARCHGLDPKQAVVELSPGPDNLTVPAQQVLDAIAEHGDSLACVMLGNCNYLSGQCFDMEAIAKRAHEVGATVGFNLAHGMGNLRLQLHQWQVDFAVWCSYKYLNGGPGAIAGAFIHERHHGNPEIPRFEGWWGNRQEGRFAMESKFDPSPNAQAWQVSNPPILQLAALRSSLELFERATLDALLAKSQHLTGHLEQLLKHYCGDLCTVVTPAPPARGAMLSLRFHHSPQEVEARLRERGAVVDFRSPDIIRIAPAPLYNSYSDVFQLVQLIGGCD